MRCLCGQPPEPGTEQCRYCRIYDEHDEKQRLRRAELMGPCKCGAPRDDPDKKMCARCRERSRTKTARQRAKNQAVGKCACGRQIKTDHKTCWKCRSQSKHSMRQARDERAWAGLCTQCGKHPARYLCATCEKCYCHYLAQRQRRTREKLERIAKATANC